MSGSPTLAPGVPSDYYERINDVELRHGWYRGMRAITRALLGDRLDGSHTVLDAGCGTGGMLRWLLDGRGVVGAAGADLAAAAVELARERVPEADLRVAPMSALPFDDASFTLVVTGDVLQHVPESEVEQSLAELRRVLRPGGTLLVRTNGARRLRRERDDWRAYDRETLRRVLEAAGFRCERLTYANTLLSLWAAATGKTPHGPSEERHGIPMEVPRGFRNELCRRILGAEARWLRRPGRTLPYGHTLFALAVAV